MMPPKKESNPFKKPRDRKPKRKVRPNRKRGTKSAIPSRAVKKERSTGLSKAAKWSIGIVTVILVLSGIAAGLFLYFLYYTTEEVTIAIQPYPEDMRYPKREE
ncbi:hypothetical protein BOVATA_024840 [Babesia ovata]|uniref:Uncharacterized protein n=1 Tax=Babesia ovata TaxID=189622 RepID=A0A2H6KDC6_9APIC|nr:uncharacterized protein BOVATA_024840 [Babesia ovata]GBE60991.1 hypothetical protein BOVATA_024840 [Babesia ovata]